MGLRRGLEGLDENGHGGGEGKGLKGERAGEWKWHDKRK